MKLMKTYLAAAAITLTFTTSQAQKLKSFGSLTEVKAGPITKKVPYTDVNSYLGYAAPDTEDEIVDGKKFYYIYLWVPAVAPELGVRMMSPVTKKTKVKDPIMGASYEANKGSDAFFDTYITLERSDVITKNGIANIEAANWWSLAKNDDSSEMPKQPSKKSYNSLLRYKSKVGDPKGALTRGLYRIGFTSYKKGEVKGTFLAQLATPVKMPGVLMAKTPEELLKLMK
jgi:hypothetical protein